MKDGDGLMSVDHRAQLVIGWRIDTKDLDDELIEALLDKEYLHIIDPWDEKDDYILGIELCSIDCDRNECVSIGMNTALSEEQYDELIILWAKVYPKKTRPFLQYYLLGGCF